MVGRLDILAQRSVKVGEEYNATVILSSLKKGKGKLTLLENGASGIFNASGPPAPLTMGALLETCRSATAADAQFTWVDDAFLIREEVTPWSDVPLWLPATMLGPILDSELAYRAGLTCRPLGDTVRDLLAGDIHVQSVAFYH